LFSVEYAVGEFVEFIDNSNQRERRFGRIEAIVSLLLPQDSDHPQDALKMSRLLRHDELGIYCSHARSRRGHKELWMIEEDYQIIPPDHILGRVLVWLKDLPQPTFYDFYVSEILYRNATTNRLQIRAVNLRHRHPSEYVVAPNPSPVGNMKVFKFMIDIYNDDFGTFRNVYHSLGGIYIQIGNMPFNLRKQLKNHFIVGFIPFGGHFDDVMRPFLQELRRL